MVSEYEARKLQRDMHDELAGATGALLKSAVGLLVVVLLAIFGPALDPQAEPASGQVDAKGAVERRL